MLCVVLALPLVACSKDGTDVEGFDRSKEYKITFDVGDEAREAGVRNQRPVTVKGGQTIGDDFYTPFWPGHTFGGWFDGNQQFFKETKVGRDWNLLAKWADDSAQEEIAQQYESQISSWDQPGHLYIHYKRAGHSETEQDKAYKGSGPEYDNKDLSIQDSALYSDWGLWLWPTNGETAYNGKTYSYEGVLFYPSKIDASGAVYDILLYHDYARGGWYEDTL